MTDNLRDRIAAVIRREVPCHPPAADRVADAVIAALGLERQDHYDPDCNHYRYVTDWIAPNE